MRFYIEEIVCILRTQVTMEIEGEEGNVTSKTDLTQH